MNYMRFFMCHLLAGSETSLKYTELLLEDVKNAPKGDGLHVLWMHIYAVFTAAGERDILITANHAHQRLRFCSRRIP